MTKSPVPSSDSSFSSEVPFPSATLEFLDGLQVSLYPNSSMTHSVIGVHYMLEMRDKEGQAASIRITFGSRRRDFTAEPGPEFQRYVELESRSGMPLDFFGKDHCFHFKGKNSSFVPRDNNYRVSQAIPGGGFTIEVDPFFLNCLRLYYEPPYKGSGEADL